MTYHSCIETSLPIANHYTEQPCVKKLHRASTEKAMNVLACAVRAMMGIGGRVLCTSYARISSVASMPPMKGMETSI